MSGHPELDAPPAMHAAPPVARYGVAGRHLVRLDDAVAGYYLGHLAVAHTRRERWGAMLLRALEAVSGWSHARSFRRRLAPSAVTRPAWEPLLSHATSLVGGLGALEPGIIVHDYAGTGRDRTLFFLFEEGASAPVALLKARPTTAAGRTLAEEWRALRHLAERLPPALAGTVPAPLAFGEDAEIEALLVSALPGRSGYVELRRTIAPPRRADAQLRGAIGWLAAFQAATRTPHDVIDPAALIADARVRLARTGVTERREAAPLLDGLAELAGAPPLARAASHGDFWVRNVLYAPAVQQVAVVDWEQFAPLASPVDDLFHFLVSYGMSFPWGRGVRGADAFARTFVARNAVARATGRVLDEWRERHGLTRRSLRALFLLHLLTRADDALAGAPAPDVSSRSRWLDCYRTIAGAGRSVFSG